MEYSLKGTKNKVYGFYLRDLVGYCYPASYSLLRNAQLLKQFAFPPELIPISSVLANFINLIFGLKGNLPTPGNDRFC